VPEPMIRTGAFTWTPKQSPEPLVVPLLGRLEGATNPESADMLLDGEHFVFGNCTMSLDHPARSLGHVLIYMKDEAFISLGRIGPDKKVELVKRKVADHLTATLGVDVLKADNAAVGAGVAFIAEGGHPVAPRDKADLIEDFRPRLLAVDALGKGVVGEIPLGDDSVIGRKYHGLEQPNGVAADRFGNLYVGDIAHGGVPGCLSAIYCIPRAAIPGLMAGDDAAGAMVSRILMPGHVNGLSASPNDDTIWAVSCSVDCPVGGGIYQINPMDFHFGRLPEPRVRGIGAGILDGVGLTKRGSLLTSTPRDGGLHIFLPNGDHRIVVTKDGPATSLAPDFNVCYPKALGGEPAVLVPDLAMASTPGQASVAMLDLSGY